MKIRLSQVFDNNISFNSHKNHKIYLDINSSAGSEWSILKLILLWA